MVSVRMEVLAVHPSAGTWLYPQGTGRLPGPILLGSGEKKLNADTEDFRSPNLLGVEDFLDCQFLGWFLAGHMGFAD